MISKLAFQTIVKCKKILPIISFECSNINAPPAKYTDVRKQLLENGWRDLDPTHTKSQTTHLSNAEVFIHKIPVLKVHQNVVRCMGGTQPGTGHPVVYLQLDTRKAGQPVSCKYCGLRYALQGHHH